MIMSWGPQVYNYKKRRERFIVIHGRLHFPAAAYPMEEIVDPTGAGDAFAGGFIGYLSQQNLSKSTLSRKQ